MPRLYLIAILLCAQQLLPILANPAGEDGEWIDDVSNNPEVMGLLNTDSSDDDQSSPVQSAPVTRTTTISDPETGEWVDDVTGNLIVMGEDPLSRGNIDDMNSNDNRKKRGAGKKIAKALKKALKKGKREINLVAESPIREKRGAAKKILKALKKAMKH